MHAWVFVPMGFALAAIAVVMGTTGCAGLGIVTERRADSIVNGAFVVMAVAIFVAVCALTIGTAFNIDP